MELIPSFTPSFGNKATKDWVSRYSTRQQPDPTQLHSSSAVHGSSGLGPWKSHFQKVAMGIPPQKKINPRARNDYDEETAYGSYMNPEPGFQSGPGDSANAD